MCSKSAIIKNKKISYSEKGSGQTIVLLHGYLETKEVWNEFAHHLSKHFKVICIDIPGHGESENIGEIHDMDTLAEHINELLTHLKINIYTLVGHSMGGYVSLAIANNYANNLNGLVLFHSSVYSDNDEKKKNRQREIDYINQGKKDLLFNVNLPNMFAKDNVKRFKNELTQIQNKAAQLNESGICALLRGMMNRRDQQNFISTFNKPTLFIFGEKDNYIAIEAGQKMLALNPKTKGEWLTNSGHMGFIEEQEKALMLIKEFADKL